MIGSIECEVDDLGVESCETVYTDEIFEEGHSEAEFNEEKLERVQLPCFDGFLFEHDK